MTVSYFFEMKNSDAFYLLTMSMGGRVSYTCPCMLVQMKLTRYYSWKMHLQNRFTFNVDCVKSHTPATEKWEKEDTVA